MRSRLPNPFRTPVPFWGQTTYSLSTLSPYMGVRCYEGQDSLRWHIKIKKFLMFQRQEWLYTVVDSGGYAVGLVLWYGTRRHVVLTSL